MKANLSGIKVWLLLSMILGFSPAAQGQSFTDCSNEPPGSTPLNSHTFDSVTGDGWWNVYPDSDYSIIVDNTAPKSPPYVIQQRRRPNSTGGAWTGVDFPNKREVYACMWWKPSDPFYGWSNNTQKIVSFQPDSNMFLMWFGDRTAPRVLGVLLQSGQEMQHHASCSWKGVLLYGSCNLYPNRSSGVVSGGQWHKIEWYVKSSNSKTSYDGVVRWWVDGTLAGDYGQVNTYATGYSNFQLNHTWDSGDPNQPTTDYHWFDHVHLSAPNGGAVPPPPPPPPTTPPPPPPPVAGTPGTVTDLAASQIGATSLTLSFNQVSDGNGSAAKYDVRFGPAASGWGALSSVSQGTCSTPLQGTATSGTLTCTVTGLSPSTAYDFQLVAFSGVMNQGATYGGLSNVASATTAAPPGPVTDINGDGSTNVTDVQLSVNQAVGASTCGSGDVNGDGACNVADVQKVVNATFGL